jgi:hypothetical protein
MVQIDSCIRKLAEEHYKYGAHMKLCIGKARGIRNILEYFYNAKVSLEYVWNVLEEYINEPKE